MKLYSVFVASLIALFVDVSAALAADYTARARPSQFDPFTVDSGPNSAAVVVTGGVPGGDYFKASASAYGLHSFVEAFRENNALQNKTAEADIDNLSFTLSSEVNALATGGTVTIRVPYTIVYYLDVSEPPAATLQASATLNYTVNGRLQPADILIGNESGAINLLNAGTGGGNHGFTQETGAFAGMAVEAALTTVSDTLELTFNESPGNPITIELLSDTSSTSGGSGGESFADARMNFYWSISASDILDEFGTPVEDSDVDVDVEQFMLEIPFVAPAYYFALVSLLVMVAYRQRRS